MLSTKARANQPARNFLTATSITDRSQAFVESVLRLEPKFAAFDCDGTLWSGDVGVDFFNWEMDEKLVSEETAQVMRARYDDYLAGKVPEEVMCGEMVTMHRGLIEADVQRAATRFFDLYFVETIFPEMQQLARELQKRGCDVWAVSSSNEWLIRAAVRHFGIPRDHVLATAVVIENLRITDRLIRVPSGPGKPDAIQKVVNKKLDAAFGNSRWDADMLARAEHGFAINPNPDLKEMAAARGWTVYLPRLSR
jgi:HAD superfamily phosphoserine phosphatase-like hydrolase